MSVNVPVTLWRDTQGNLEFGSGGNALVTTLALVQLITLAGVSLITLAGSYTNKPATAWVENDSV